MRKTFGNDPYNLFVDIYPKYKITKPIRLIEMFGGYGTFSLGLKYIGANYESYKLVEWAIKSIQAYKNIHFTNDDTDYSKDLSVDDLKDYLFNKGLSSNYNEPMTRKQIDSLSESSAREIYNNIQATHNLVDIQQVHGSDLEIIDKDKYDYVMSYSYPCVTEDSLILTKDGYKEFKDLTLNDVVLTKSNTWHKIHKLFDNGIHQTCYLDGMGFENIHCTLNHKFLIRHMYREWDNSKRADVRKFTNPEFKEVKDLVKGDYFGVPVIVDEEPFYTNDLDFWFLVGYYLGDGWLSKYDNQIRLAANDKKLEILKSHLTNINYHVNWGGTCWQVNFTDKSIYNFLDKFIGTGSSTKFVSGEILRLPKDCLMALYEGYLSSDGCVIKGKHQFTSTSRNLIYSLGVIINKLFCRPVCIYKTVNSNKCSIQGRVVNQKDYYTLRFNPVFNKQDKAFYKDGYIWYPFNKIILGNFEHVYNMEVEDDHSYIIQGCISKNCQDLSLAGTRQGMSDTSTRSGMLWEVERILNELYELDSLPQILIMENVPQVHDDTNYKDFCKWIVALEDLGYRNYWKDLAATDYGIPQTRNRCFMVSILGEYSFEFPETIPLDKKLRDMLEPEVPERYFLSNKQIEQVVQCTFVSNDFKHRVMDPESSVTTITAHNSKDPKYVDLSNGEPLYKQVLDDYLDSGEAEEGQVLKTNYISSVINGSQDLVKSKDVMPTLTTSSESESAVVVNNSIRVKNATKQGYLEAEEGDGVDISGRVKYHRGTVQKDMAQTLTTAGGASVGVVVGTYDYNSSKSFMSGKERFKEGADTIGTILTTHTDGVVIDTSEE